MLYFKREIQERLSAKEAKRIIDDWASNPLHIRERTRESVIKTLTEWRPTKTVRSV